MNKRPDVVAQTKNNIIQAFWMLYTQKRMEQISITEISKIAGYNRSTFYEYFTDIYDVLNTFEADLLEELRCHVFESLKEDVIESDAIHVLAHMYVEKGEYLGILLSEKGDPQFVRKIKEVMKPQIIKHFNVDETDPLSEYIFEFGMSSIIGTLTHWYNSGMNVSAEELAALLRSMLASAVLPYLL